MGEQKERSIAERIAALESTLNAAIGEINRLEQLHLLHGHDNQGQLFHYPANGPRG